MSEQTTRVFNNGNSQAVRIPAEFRLSTDRVIISRNKRGELILRPITVRRGTALLKALEQFDDNFIKTLQDDRATPLPIQDREPL
jgi:antitoxin VapB